MNRAIVKPEELLGLWPQAGMEETSALDRVCQSSAWCRLGDNDWQAGECGLFEREFAKYLQSEHVLAVSHGTMAIELALQAVGVTPGDEILVQAGTFFGTVTPMLRLGATPVFVDIHPNSLTVDPDSLASRRTDRTVGVVVVPLCGLAPDMDRISTFCSEHGLWLLEDCAQAVGSVWRGRALGTIGQVGTFSFQQSKVLQAGEGGAICCNSRDLLSRAFGFHQGFATQGSPPLQKHLSGTNGRMTSWQAAVLRCQLQRLTHQLETRLSNHRRLCEQLTADDPITPILPLPQMERWGMFAAPLLFSTEKAGGMSRDKFITELTLRGVPATPGHIEPLYWRPLFRDNPDLPHRYPDCPITERASRESYLTLMHWFFLGKSTWIDSLVEWIRTIQ